MTNEESRTIKNLEFWNKQYSEVIEELTHTVNELKIKLAIAEDNQVVELAPLVSK